MGQAMQLYHGEKKSEVKPVCDVRVQNDQYATDELIQ